MRRSTLASLDRRLGPGTLFNEAAPAGEYTFLLAKHHDRTYAPKRPAVRDIWV
jgi:hypothetical protein